MMVQANEDLIASNSLAGKELKVSIGEVT